ncbi:MAG: pyridoxamine 5'-phosphate oxidase family protein [Gemmatimonadaceae bacterium]
MLLPDSFSPRGPQYARITALIESFHAAMFTCVGTNGAPCSWPLPMRRDPQNQLLYLPSLASSPVVAEVERDARALVTMQDRRVYVSLTGRAMVTGNRSVLAERWSDRWLSWFPEGANDPQLRLVCFAPHTGEYWEDDSHGLAQLVQSAKVLLTNGDAPPHTVDHAKVSLSYWYTS